MSAKVPARHDDDDLRRLAELGIAALDWRPPPARVPRAVIIDSDGATTATLSYLVKGLTAVGISAHLNGRDATAAVLANAVVIHFGARGITASPNAHTALDLPPLAELRGNAEAKRQVWSQIRALLRK